MSDLAITNVNSEAKSAWDYRSLFLGYGTKYDKFYCPYCGVELIPKVIYKDEDEKAAKSPHFATKKNHDHDEDCIESSGSNKKETSSIQKARINGKIMTFPELLLDKPEKNESDANGRQTSEPEVRRLIKSKSDRFKTRGSVMSRVYNLEGIVRAKNMVYYSGRKSQKEKGWNDNEFYKWFNDKTNHMPLRLFSKETAMTYHSAFIHISFFYKNPDLISAKTKKIYWGSGIAHKGADFYRIKSNLKTGAEKKNFFIAIVNFNLHNQTKYAEQMFKVLEISSRNGDEIQWYAVGLPENREDDIYLNLRNINHLFVKYKQ